jgi:hypothetical protein
MVRFGTPIYNISLIYEETETKIRDTSRIVIRNRLNSDVIGQRHDPIISSQDLSSNSESLRLSVLRKKDLRHWCT